MHALTDVRLSSVGKCFISRRLFPSQQPQCAIIVYFVLPVAHRVFYLYRILCSAAMYVWRISFRFCAALFSAHLFCAPSPNVCVGFHSMCSRVFRLHVLLGQRIDVQDALLPCVIAVDVSYSCWRFFPPTSSSVPQLCLFRV